MYKPLRWQNRWVEELKQAVDYSPFSFPEIAEQAQLDDSGEPFWYAIELSEEQFTEIFSSVVNGAELTYPEKSQQVQWNFWKLIMTPLCEAVLQSFMNNQECEDGLKQYLASLGIGQGGGLDPNAPINGIITENLNANTDCSENGKYGVAFEIAGMMNTVTEDFLDHITGISEDVEMAGELLDSIPILGSLASVAVDYAEWLLDEIVTDYISAWDTTVQDEIACAIYNSMCSDCVLTLDGMLEAYGALAPSDPLGDLSTFAQWVAWFTGFSAPSDTELVALMHLGILTAWRFGSTWFGSQHRLIEIYSSQASSLAPPMGCDCDDLWCYEWDFEAEQGDWEQWNWSTRAGGEYVENVGWKPTTQFDNPYYYHDVSIRIPISPETNVTRVTIGFYWDEGTYAFSSTAYAVRADNGAYTFDAKTLSEMPNETATYYYVESGDHDSDYVNLLLRPYFGSSATPNGDATILYVKLQGTGTNPFGTGNC